LCFTYKEEQILRFENKLLRGMVGSDEEEVTGIVEIIW
jgi:hypothetical protein